jgi:translocation and assembly module TamA
MIRTIGFRARPQPLRVAWMLLAIGAAAGVPLQAGAQDGLRYEVSFLGLPDGDLLERFRELAETVTLREERPPASVVHLQRRAARDQETFLTLLHSRGHYGALVDIELDEEVRPVQLTFRVEPGPRYVLREVEVRPAEPDGPGAPSLPTAEEIGLPPGQAFRAQAVLDAQQRLLSALRERGHAFAAIADRRVIVDHADQTVSVTFEVAAGPEAQFGPVTVEGLEKVREEVIHGYVDWQEGARYDERLLSTTQHELYRSGLFSLVRVAHAEDAPVDATVPIVIEVIERKHRTIAIGAQYRTDEGASVRLRWEHRNMRRLGHALGVDVTVGQIQTSLETTYRLRRWRRDDQTLQLSGHIGEWRPDAYTSQRVGVSAFVERELSAHWTAGAGLAARWDDIEQAGASRQYNLLSMPWRAAFDDTDDPLNPAEGRRLIFHAEPFVALGGANLAFIKGETSYSEYFSLDADRDWLLAVRARLGLTGGAAHGDIPPDERFYAGGAASIRGYAYQSVGPLDRRNDPLGGRSVFDMSVELRRKLTESIGMVAFLDGGSAYEDAWPTFSHLRWGAGLGMRYFTPIGPVGLDVGVPLNKRGFDSSFQVYVTLGQAF